MKRKGVRSQEWSVIRLAPSVKHGKKHWLNALKQTYPGCKFSKVQVKRNYQREYTQFIEPGGWQPYTMKATIKCPRKYQKIYFD